MKKGLKKSKILPLLLIILMVVFTNNKEEIKNIFNKSLAIPTISYNVNEIPEYNGSPVIVINNNVPLFTDEDYNSKTFESYSELDILGRCGIAFANIDKSLMPTTKRGSIGMIKPSGWHTIKYDNVDGKYLYNRCHLIGYQLTGENDNKKNLITCTRFMNTKSMLEYENKVANYIKKTGNNVLYRVTPVFYDDNLLVSGVLIEAASVYDKGKDLSFFVFIYNIQDGILIDYKTGDSKLVNSKAN